MSRVSGIICQIVTGNVEGAGTDGSVYLGLGGREFRLDSSADDYERGSLREYVMGRGPFTPLIPPQILVRNDKLNNPRAGFGFPLDTVNLTRAPVYIRFEPEGPDDRWNLAFAAALVYDGSFVVAFTPPADFDNLWLGQASGKVLYLTDAYWRDGQMILDSGRQVADRIRKNAASPRRRTSSRKKAR